MKWDGCPTLLLAIGLTLASTTALPAQSGAQGAAADDLAKKLQNSVSDLISVPIESNWEFREGPTHATDYSPRSSPVGLQVGADLHRHLLVPEAILMRMTPRDRAVLIPRGPITRLNRKK